MGLRTVAPPQKLTRHVVLATRASVSITSSTGRNCSNSRRSMEVSCLFGVSGGVASSWFVQAAASAPSPSRGPQTQSDIGVERGGGHTLQDGAAHADYLKPNLLSRFRPLARRNQVNSRVSRRWQR